MKNNFGKTDKQFLLIKYPIRAGSTKYYNCLITFEDSTMVTEFSGMFSMWSTRYYTF